MSLNACEVAVAVDERIDQLRREMGLTGRFEFHFNKMKASQRKQFLSAIAAYEFFYWGIVINKAQLRGARLQFKESFCKFAYGLVFEIAKPRLTSAIVVVDGSGSEGFRNQLKTYVARRLVDDSGKSLIKKLKIQDSAKNNLLQLADMVVGAVARAYGGKADAAEYRKLITHREMSVQLWPK